MVRDKIEYEYFASEDWPLITQFEDPEKAGSFNTALVVTSAKREKA